MKSLFFTVAIFLCFVIKAQVSDSTSLIVTDSITKSEVSKSEIKPEPSYNKYGDLLNDDPAYNKKYPAWIPATRVLLCNGFVWAVDRYVFNFDFAHINPDTWKSNLKQGWKLDNDGFGVNFIGHPYHGSYYFNIARSNGYNYWQSIPFAFEGSLMWEYFGEATRPSYNDIINTPISGMFLGEILYRLSSNMLDDRTRGGNRFFRELVAGILTPTRALNRLTQGKMSRHTSNEVYQKEPLNVTLFAGIHKVNENRKFGSGTTNGVFNLQFDYGDPFEERHRKPFDFFKLKTELSINKDRKLVENVNGYGILVGKNILTRRKHPLLIGLFQHYDYWDNNLFELGSLAFGLGIISKIPLTTNSNIFSSLHFAGVPLAGNSTHYGVSNSEYRDYNFGGGFLAKADETMNIGKWGSFGFTAYYYWVYSYPNQRTPGLSQVVIFKPRVAIRLFGNTSIGMEQQIYHNDRSLQKIPNFSLTTTEQKFFIQIFLEDKKRTEKFH